MYLPTQFEETRSEVLHAAMAAHPLATLVTLTRQGLCANHIPMVLRSLPDGGHALVAHVARSNPLWQDFDPKVPALAVFQGPQCYITPNWYATKKEHGKAVPTWNYVAVHASGPLTVHDDAKWVYEQLVELTRTHERPRLDAWAVENAPFDFTERLVEQLVGLEIRIASLQGKWKVSQNQSQANREGVVRGLRAEQGTWASEMDSLVEAPFAAGRLKRLLADRIRAASRCGAPA